MRSITSNGRKAIFQPQQELKSNTNYTATITSDVKDLEANALEQIYTWAFKTELADGGDNGGGDNDGGGGSGGGGCYINLLLYR